MRAVAAAPKGLEGARAELCDKPAAIVSDGGFRQRASLGDVA